MAIADGQNIQHSNSNEIYTFSKPLPGAISVPTHDALMIKLSDEEYFKLIAMRQAVLDEEKRLAVKYGAVIYNPTPCPPYCATMGYGPTWQSDTYTFHQQFLLIYRGNNEYRNNALGYATPAASTIRPEPAELPRPH
jgi:hypothetical protein